MNSKEEELQKQVMTKQDIQIPTRGSEFERVVLPEEEEIMEQIIPKDPLETRNINGRANGTITPRAHSGGRAQDNGRGEYIIIKSNV